MYTRKENGPVAVTLPDGTQMTRSDLPPRDTLRWVASRKAAVVKGVVSGLITQAEACKWYGLSDEEFNSWLSGIESHGMKGLKATKLQECRQP